MGSVPSFIRRAQAPELPMELWHAIFDHLEIWDLLALRCLSHYILDVVRAHPLYLRYIEIRTDRGPQSLDMVRSRIDSSTLPLCIDIALGHSAGVRKYCTRILALVAKNMHRVDRLHLDLAPAYREIIHQTFKAAPAPLLRRFVVKYTPCLYRGCFYCERPAAIVMPTVFGGYAPRLTELELHNVFLDRKHPYPAFHNARNILLFAGTAECVPIELVRRLCPRLETLNICGRYCVVGRDPIETYTTRRRPSHELNVVLGNLSEACQATALAEIIAVRSKIVVIANPSPRASQALYHHFSDASNVYMGAFITYTPGGQQTHILFEDPSTPRMRVLVTDFARTEYERQQRAIQYILAEMQGLKRRISVLHIDCDLGPTHNMFTLLNGWEGQWSTCEAICLTFGGPSISSTSSSSVIGLDAATFPVLKLLVICCYHPDSPKVKDDARRLDILTTSLRELLSDEGTKNIDMVYTRDIQVALNCARTPVKTLATPSCESWTWL